MPQKCFISIKRKGLYHGDDIYSNNTLTSQSSTCAKKYQIWMWHRRFGHASFGCVMFVHIHNINGPSLILVCIDSKINTNNLINDHVLVCGKNGYQLPPRSNQGKPPVRYSPDHSKTSKYPIAHYHFSYYTKAFMNQMSIISIPTSIQEALTDPKWEASMTEEM
ncbi:hypothetical protein CR513_05166, partial [Mucuna pruriens]